MKKNYILTLFLSLLISGLTFGQTLMITTISDGDCSGGVPKMVEIYVQGEVNLSLYSLKNLSISSTSGTSSLNSFGTVTDDFIYVYYDTTTPEEVFATEYPSATPSIEATVASFNGDDVIRIVRNSDQTIIDQYGDTDGGIQDGTGTPWEYKDGYAKRINGTTSSGEFTIGDWNVVNGGLDGQGSCQGGTIFEDVMGGVGVYTAPVVYDLLEDFETALPAGALVGDSGMATTPEVVADPATGGTNGDVLKIVTSAAGNGWQNAQLFLQGDLLDLTTDDKVVTVDVYSESAFMMLAKTATPSNGGAESATDASHTGSGWETLTFDFSDPKDNTPVANDIFGRILFFPQWNGAGWNDSSVTTTYVDNIKGTGYTAPVVYDLLEDFETALPAGALVGDSGMATTPEVVADPATGGTNGDVLKIVTSAAGNGWQNAQLFLQGDLLDLTTDDKVVTVDVYSESAFMMLAKTATPSNGGAESATDASHTGSGWETLTFDFSDPKDNTPVANDIFGRILFFPQWNGAGWNDSSVTTTYVDNIKGTGYTAPVVYDLLEDFETALPAGALVGDSGMATTPEVVADPATGGTNGDVLKIVTSAAGNGWQNAQLFLQGDLLDLTTDDKVVTVDVYSESAFMMLAKTATPSNGGAESATDASHTGSGWETLTFDFSDPKDNTPVANDIFGRILFFPQWNGAGWNDSSVTTTYVDNIKGTGYTAPVVYDLLEDFETALPAGALVGDSGMATTPEVVADPATGGTNGDVLKIVTSAAGNGWQNAQLFLQGDLLDLTTDDKVVTVDVYSESAFMMLAKTATPSNGGAESATDASHTGSGWETLTFDFSDPKDNTPVANDIFGRILFFPQWNGAGWNDSSVTTTYVDNIKGTGYTAPVVVVYDLLEDFETALPAGALVGDSGMATTPEVVADPATGGTNGDVLKIVTSAAGNGWQNAQLFFQGDLLDLTTDDKVVTVDVYSESAFMMLAKTATPSNGGAESATDASHTGSGWETLTFDFSDPKDNTPVANDIFGRILFFPQWNGAGWNDSSVTTTYVDNIKGIGYESTPPTGDNSVTIATTQAWNSYVNVFSVSDNSYQFGFGDIEVSDLRATATETSVTLEPNISIWTNESTNDAYFDQDAASQTPVAYIEASTYIENASLANNALTFSGNISTSDLGDDYTVIAFIKSLTSSYDQVAFKSVDISSTGDFTVTATAEEMSQAVIQYGFAVTGPLADPSDTTLGSVVIGAETLGIEDTDIVNVSVYPNPSNSNWNFRTPNTVITSVEVFNLLGKRVVLRKNNSTDIAISTQGLTSGIYIARITTEQGTKSVKLIKE